MADGIPDQIELKKRFTAVKGNNGTHGFVSSLVEKVNGLDTGLFAHMPLMCGFIGIFAGGGTILAIKGAIPGEFQQHLPETPGMYFLDMFRFPGAQRYFPGSEIGKKTLFFFGLPDFFDGAFYPGGGEAVAVLSFNPGYIIIFIVADDGVNGLIHFHHPAGVNVEYVKTSVMTKSFNKRFGVVFICHNYPFTPSFSLTIDN
jgi:hypothetical protein